MVSTEERVKGASMVFCSIFIIMTAIFVPLTAAVRSFAILAGISLLGVIAMLVVWVIAETFVLGIGSGTLDWFREQWNYMMGRDDNDTGV